MIFTRLDPHTSNILQLDSDWQVPRGVGQGLENQGATCYINSTVQCLVHNPILANLGFGVLRRTCKCKGCALCYLGYRVRCSFSTTGNAEAAAGYPKWMINSGLATLGTLSRDRLSASKQEDAHDFLRQWLDKAHDLHEKLLKSGQPGKQTVYTVVDRVFGGVLASRVQCQHCGQVSSMYDSMNDLSVEVDDGLYGVVDSVEKALTKFIEPEVMSGDNAYHCDWCQRKQTAHKSLHIHTAPNTLTLHLKRFRPDFVKLTGHIAFPLQLNLAPFLSPDSPDGPEGQPPFQRQQHAFPQQEAAFQPQQPDCSQRRVSYRLIGVLVHTGSWSSAGHYFSYVLDSEGQWWVMNDELRYKVSTDEVLNKCDAYILFYVRNQPRQDPPVVPRSHVAPPPIKKRCATLLPLEDGELGDDETDEDTLPLAKRSKYQQQQQQALLPSLPLPSPVLAITEDDSQLKAESGQLSHMAAPTQDAQPDGIDAHCGKLLSEANGWHRVGGNTAAALLDVNQHNGLAPYANGHSHAAANGHAQCQPAGQPQLSKSNAPPHDQASVNGVHQIGASTDPLASTSQQSQVSVDEPSWLSAHDPAQAAARGPSQAAASSPGPAGGSPKRGFLGFSLKKSLHKMAADQAACMTPPSQRVKAPGARLPGDETHALSTSELTHDAKALDLLAGKARQKRPRPEAMTEQDSELELVLEDEAQAASSQPQAQGRLLPSAGTAPGKASMQTPNGIAAKGRSAQVHPTFFPPHAQQQPHPQQQPQLPSQYQSSQLPSLHQRTPAPSFMGRKQATWSRPEPALLTSDAPPHIKFAPSQARPQPVGQPPQPPPKAPSSHPGKQNAVSSDLADGSGSKSSAAPQTAVESHAPGQVAREAFPMAFGANKRPDAVQPSWQARAQPSQIRANLPSTAAAPGPASKQQPSNTTILNSSFGRHHVKADGTVGASSQQGSVASTSARQDGAKARADETGGASRHQSHQQARGVSAKQNGDATPGPLQAGLQAAAKGSSRAASAGKSARKAGVLGRMMNTAASTVTSWLQLPKAAEEASQAHELQKLAALYPSDGCSDEQSS